MNVSQSCFHCANPPLGSHLNLVKPLFVIIYHCSASKKRSGIHTTQNDAYCLIHGVHAIILLTLCHPSSSCRTWFPAGFITIGRWSARLGWVGIQIATTVTTAATGWSSCLLRLAALCSQVLSHYQSVCCLWPVRWWVWTTAVDGIIKQQSYAGWQCLQLSPCHTWEYNIIEFTSDNNITFTTVLWWTDDDDGDDDDKKSNCCHCFLLFLWYR